ncbi:SET and MYND domain-containing protein 3 [Podila epigama]|nr:SET and MYND domain-containing protein 3 [Podila epigama]
MLPPQDSSNEATSSAATPAFNKGSGRTKERNYRSKQRSHDSDEDLENPTTSSAKTTLPTDVSSTVADHGKSEKGSKLLYVESQDAHVLGEVYPELARLSFVEQAAQEVDQDSVVQTPTRMFRQPDTAVQQPTVALDAQSDEASGAQSVTAATPLPSLVPTLTPPSVLSAGSPSRLVEIRDTGLLLKGRGLFSAANETLKPGTLIFKELGYCQVVNDASLPYVCSACFKDTRDEQGENETSATTTDARTGQRKLTCQVKDWKLHHQLECQGIQKSLANASTKDIWTKRTLDTTSVRALCRLVRRRERVLASAAYQAQHGKIDSQQKQVNEVYFSGLDQKEEEWLDMHGASWIEKYLNMYESEPTPPSATAKGELEESGKLAKIMAVVMSCVVPSKENRQIFLKGSSSSNNDNSSTGFELLRKLNAYGFAISNLETTTPVGLGLYIQSMAFMNHSCVPNCVYTFKGSKVECRVIRDIQPGEEMTISYIDQIGTTKERQHQLKDHYHFTCECPLCQYYPMNLLVKVSDTTLETLINVQISKPGMDPKQGYICSNPACNSPSILATHPQLAIYNFVKVECSSCGSVTELTQELVEENQEECDRLVSNFIREMRKGASSTTTNNNSRNFELAKASDTVTADAKAAVGGMKTVQEPSSAALRYFEDAYRGLTGQSLQESLQDGDIVRRSELHHAIRHLQQTGFDEAVARKNWVFALKRSIQLESILRQVYIGYHPIKPIQSYYSCKIANLLANLLLEESTIDIEDSDEENADNVDSDDERDLEALRKAMESGRRTSNNSGTKRTKLVEGETMDEAHPAKKVKESKRKSQEQSSRELLEYLKSLVPKIENPQVLQEFRVCWGKDGRLSTRYRHQVDSLKQALHYAEKPFIKG